jgi:molybdopterin-guanine dinucleotide biosynthesis protein
MMESSDNRDATQSEVGGEAPERSFSGRIARLNRLVGRIDTRRSSGRLLAVTGPLVRADLPGAEVGELCEMRDPDTGETRLAEVVGLDNATAFLAPYGGSSGLSIRTEVVGLRRPPTVMCGDHLLGTVIDALGNFMHFEGAEPPRPGAEAERRRISAQAPDPMTREPISKPLGIGIRAIDSLLTVGEGQRMGIFGTAGGGKSTLMSEIVMRSSAEVTVVALVGERGREVNDFIEKALTKESRAKTVVVVATSDRPSVERMQASMTATAVAEHFRDRGMKVLLFVDTVTRLARALREQWQIDDIKADLSVLTKLQPVLRKGNWQVTVALYRDHHAAPARLLDIWPGLYEDGLYGLAIDLGSTTIAAHLCDLVTGKVLCSSGVMNPQIRFGEDLMSRVSYAMMNPGGDKDMTRVVRTSINALAQNLDRKSTRLNSSH